MRGPSRFWSVVLSGIVVASAFAQEAPRPDSLQPLEAELREFEQFIDREMRFQQMPALSVAVMKDDFIWARGFGFADLENRVPATADSSYRMASLTKPMTAVGIMNLVEQGRINLDAEIQTYVPHFPRKAQPITVRQLLGHLGGISHYQNYGMEGRIREPRNSREALAIFQDFDLVAEPGTRYHYSSYGYNLLGAAIEGASGTSYGEFMQLHVWEPLGMNSTRMDHPRDIIPNRVRGYTIEGGKIRNSEYVDMSSRFAAGGTRSTVVDLVRFIQGLERAKVLQPRNIELMFTRLVTRDGRATRYGLGWNVAPIGGRFVVGHSGSQQETRTQLWWLPAERIAIALASNLEEANLSTFRDRLVLLLLGSSWTTMPYLRDPADAGVARVLRMVFNEGLGYYDRYGQQRTGSEEDLEDAFLYFKEAVRKSRIGEAGSSDLMIDRGRDPSAGEPFIKVGSYIAERLLQSGRDLEKYHRAGALAFFQDYMDLYRRERQIPRRYRLNRETEELVKQWAPDWTRTFNEEVARLTAAEIAESPAVRDRLVNLFAGASIVPDLTGAFAAAAESALSSGDVARSRRIANTALTLYPESDTALGIAGLSALIGGDPETGHGLLAKSLERNPRGYASEERLWSLARAFSDSIPAADRMILEEILRLHPGSSRARQRLDELAPPLLLTPN